MPSNFSVKKIKRENFSWGIWDSTEKEFIKMFETKEEAKKYLKEMLK